MAAPRITVITPENTLWNEQDAIGLRNYIANNPRFLQRIQSRLPEIKGDRMEERAMTGSEAKGWQDCVNEIRQMQADQARGGIVDRAGHFDDSSDPNS